MADNGAGFSKQQKSELVQIFSDLFKEVVLPGLDSITERLDKIEARLDKIEKRLVVLEEKVDRLQAEFYDLKRRLRDLENNSVEFKSDLDLRVRVEALEQRVGIAQE